MCSFGVSSGDDEPSNICEWSLRRDEPKPDSAFLEEVARTYGLPLMARWCTCPIDDDDGDSDNRDGDDKTEEERASEALCIQTMAVLFVCALAAAPQYAIHPTALSVQESQGRRQDMDYTFGVPTPRATPVSNVVAAALSNSFGYLADNQCSRWA
jgi:hypothetical protein